VANFKQKVKHSKIKIKGFANRTKARNKTLSWECWLNNEIRHHCDHICRTETCRPEGGKTSVMIAFGQAFAVLITHKWMMKINWGWQAQKLL
jgi:hypothetical protein